MVPNNRFWNPFYKFRVPMNRFWNHFSNLGFRPEPVPRTLQNIGFLKVPEPVPVPVGPEPFSKFRVLSRTGSKNPTKSRVL
jgi:hypothetical protein